jgi:hypothetical protein
MKVAFTTTIEDIDLTDSVKATAMWQAISASEAGGNIDWQATERLKREMGDWMATIGEYKAYWSREQVLIIKAVAPNAKQKRANHAVGETHRLG